MNEPKNEHPLTNPERQRLSRERRARAYEIVKALAQRAGYMQHTADVAGLDRYMADFVISHDEIDWFEAVDDLQE
jgi:hypothetical protein